MTPNRLKFLIGEFEKIQFLRFGKDFPAEDDSVKYSSTHQDTELISIRANGQTKEVSNYSGDSYRRTRLLRDLAEKIRGAGIWYLPEGKIPENFELWFRKTAGDKIEENIKIGADGRITESVFSSKFFPDMGKELPVLVRSKTVGKISKSQLAGLIEQFEKIGFSTFRYSTLEKYSGCTNESGPEKEKRVHINVQINQVSQMYASLYESCAPQLDTDAASFEKAVNVVETLLKTVIKK